MFLYIIIFINLVLIFALSVICCIIFNKYNKLLSDVSKIYLAVKRVRYGDINLRLRNLYNQELESLINRLFETIYDREMMIKEYQSTLSKKNLSLEEIIKQESSDEVKFKVSANKGFYVRALARDLAISLGSVGCVSYLRRIANGPFDIDNSITLDKLKKILQNLPQSLDVRNFDSDFLLPVSFGLNDILAIDANEEQNKKLRSGQWLKKPDAWILKENTFYQLQSNSKLSAIVKLDNGFIKTVSMLKIKQVDLENKKIKPLRKGRKFQDIYITDELIQLYNEYMVQRERIYLDEEAEDMTLFSGFSDTWYTISSYTLEKLLPDFL